LSRPTDLNVLLVLSVRPWDPNTCRCNTTWLEHCTCPLFQ